jgi:aminoglycoside phosphotransferase (APT) family kinase protein
MSSWLTASAAEHTVNQQKILKLNPFKRKFPRYSLPERIQRYASEILSVHWGIPPEAIHLETVPSKGKNTFLRLVTTAEGGRFLIRAYPVGRQKQKGFEHAHISQLLREHGILVPRVLVCADSAETRNRYGFEVTVEQWVEGRKPGRDAVAERGFTSELASLLGRMHGIKSTVAGKPWHTLNEKKDLPAYYLARSQLYLRRIAQHVGAPNPDALRRWETFFERAVSRFRPIREFCFVHGDVQTGNLLLTPDGKIVILDFGTCGYGYFEEDLISALFGVFSSREAAFERFLDAYFSIVGEAARARYDETQNLFLAFYHLEKSASAATRVRKIKAGRSNKSSEIASFEQKALTNWQSCLRIIDPEG